MTTTAKESEYVDMEGVGCVYGYDDDDGEERKEVKDGNRERRNNHWPKETTAASFLSLFDDRFNRTRGEGKKVQRKRGRRGYLNKAKE
jgi:hypothetical protein